MANGKTRLELTWIGKEERPRLEPRILLEDSELSYHASRRVSEGDIFDNRLIFGDNLLALKALEQEFAGQVKCIYIDPPFNTGQAFEHYDDGIENSVWLSLMRDRLDLLSRLLSEDGTLFIHIDDTQLGYLIVLLDEILGSANRISIITFKQGSATGHKAINPGCVTTTNFVLMYAKDKQKWSPQRVYSRRIRDRRYNQFIANVRSPPEDWQVITLTAAFAAHLGVDLKKARVIARNAPNQLDDFVESHPDSVIRFARPNYPAVSKEARALIDESRREPRRVFHLKRSGHDDFFFRGGERILFYSQKLKMVDGRLVAAEPLTTLWDDILSNNLHNEGGVSFPKAKKPEALLKRILELSTNPGDLVLDSFAGSGTTGAVAHKMGRRWIMVELGEHCHTHIIPRIRSAIDGADMSGVTDATGWKGGGGFRYYRLAPSLLERDSFGNWIISRKFNAAMLAEAVCKLHGFRYAPSDTIYWQHGRSSERDFIYVTTQTLSVGQLQHLSDEVCADRTLLVCCGAFRGDRRRWPNLSLEKIPKSVLSRCEWGRDDYSLSVASLPNEPERPTDQPIDAESAGAAQPRPKRELPLFDRVTEGD